MAQGRQGNSSGRLSQRFSPRKFYYASVREPHLLEEKGGGREETMEKPLEFLFPLADNMLQH